MVEFAFEPSFKKTFKKIKNRFDKEKVKDQIKKIIKEPEVGKPMRYSRKGTREVYFSPYRLSYKYIKSEEKVVFLDLYHKDKQ